MKRLAALALGLVAGAAAAADGLQLYPIRGVYFAPGGGPRGDLVDPDFRAVIGDAERAYFEEAFRRRFPDAARKLDAQTARRTFAVSLQVARASRYVVPKVDGTVDVLLPVTASLYFTNVFTGEVLYASTETLISPAQLMPAQARAGSARVRELFGQTFRELADKLIEGAAKRFKPVQVSARVRGRSNELAILDVGSDGGLAADDSLVDERGAELRVISVGPGYAVAEAVLPPVSTDTTYRKVLNGTLADVKKPRVLPIVDEAPPWFPDDALIQLFSDALGSSAPVSLVPVNRTFQGVLNTIASTTDLSQQKLRQRELPAFFVRLHVPEPITYERKTNLAYKTLRVTETLAWAELVDGSGRILYAAVGRDQIEDEITERMALPLPARREVAVKNALLALAKQFAGMRFDHLELPVSSRDGALTVKDDRGLLGPGATVRAFRSIGKVSGVKGEVLVPTFELSVNDVSDGIATLSPALAIVAGSPEVRQGDRVVVDGVAARRASHRRFGGCGEAESLGKVALPPMGSLALNRFASGYAAPVYGPGLEAAVGGLVRGGTGFKEDLKLSTPAVELCVQAAYKVDLLEPECGAGTCADVVTLAMGYRVRRGGAGGDVLARTGLSTRLKARALPSDSSREVRGAALTADVISQVLELAPAAAGAMSREKF